MEEELRFKWLWTCLGCRSDLLDEFQHCLIVLWHHAVLLSNANAMISQHMWPHWHDSNHWTVSASYSFSDWERIGFLQQHCRPIGVSVQSKFYREEGKKISQEYLLRGRKCLVDAGGQRSEGVRLLGDAQKGNTDSNNKRLQNRTSERTARPA